MSFIHQEQQWTVMDAYFQSHAYPFTKHHIDSFREFLRNYIPSIIRIFNPITMIKIDDKDQPILQVRIYVGGKSGDAIYIDRPTMIDQNNTEILLTPAEARLRNLTYEGHLYADIYIEYELTAERENKMQTREFSKVLLGAIPLMVHSDACILNGQGPDVLRELGECIYDTGGYFIIDGKEKVIVSQERIVNNKLFVDEIILDSEEDTTPDSVHFSHRAYMKCVSQTGESKLAPKGIEFYVTREKSPFKKRKDNEEDEDDEETEELRKTKYKSNAIYVSISSIQGKIPVTILFRALGVETDKEIAEMIFGSSEVPDEYIKFIRASMIDGHNPDKKNEIYTQQDALNYLKYRVQYELLEYTKSILVTDVFPNVENQKEKAIYLGFLIKQLLDTCLKINKPSDRDAYINKRIDISGFQLAELFQETYKILRKNCRDLLDREYNLGPWRTNNNARITDLVRKDNIYKLFPPTIITERFVRSLKGMWGSTDEDPEQGKVQDLARISYLGYLSHMRRINLPLDRSRKNVPPHRLHPQQWGMFCPFETPDGQSIGLLKNFSLTAYITFGTKLETIQDYLPRLGIVPLNNTTNNRILKKDTTKVLLNGTFYGITRDPVYHTRLLKALRRNGYINPFVSIAWNIHENILHIQTDPGRICRPLFIVQQNQIKIPFSITPETEKNWFYYLFGNGKVNIPEDHNDLRDIFYTEEMYYNDVFILPSWWKDPYTLEEKITAIQQLEKMQGCIEYIDVDEENTLLIAMNLDDLEQDKSYTHCEIHPTTMCSVVTNTIPFANHNYAARNLFHGAQAKQTVGVYATNFNRRFDTMAYIMHYPQKPIVTTRTSHYIAANKMPNGFNAIVAIATYTGFNQEDGIIMNRSAIERGLFHCTAYKTMSATEKVISHQERTQFRNPYLSIDTLEKHNISKEIIEHLKSVKYTTIQSLAKLDKKHLAAEKLDLKPEQQASVYTDIMEAVKKIKETIRDYNVPIQGIKHPDHYELLDENGIIREGAKISRGSKVVVMGMVSVREEQREVTRGILSEIEKVRHYRDISHMTDVHHYGVVDKVFMGTKALGGADRICKVRFRKVRRPELGNKFCSKHGQKGVVGMILPECDMPVTKDGIVPDLIINPHALPSRMTIAHLVECIFAKGCCLDGAQGDGTMFVPVDYDAFGTTLEEQGFQKHGNEVMYDGKTGRQIATDIFIGPTFYYSLKHMVVDKIHARYGNPGGLPHRDLPYDQMTRQPTEGRAKNGGLRIGEMERDVLLSYGMAQFSKESVMERSDKHRYGICRHCGIVASPLEYKKSYLCLYCKKNDVAIVETPYAWKLLVQECEAMGIQLRFATQSVVETFDDDEENEEEDDLLDADAYDQTNRSDDKDQHNQDLDEPALYEMREYEMEGGENNLIPVDDTPSNISNEMNRVNQQTDNLLNEPSSKIPDLPPPISAAPSEPSLISVSSSTTQPSSPASIPMQTGGINQLLDLDDDFPDISFAGGISLPVVSKDPVQIPSSGGSAPVKIIEISDKLAQRAGTYKSFKSDEYESESEIEGEGGEIGEMTDDFF